MYKEELGIARVLDLEVDINKLSTNTINTKMIFHKEDIFTSGIVARFTNGNKLINLHDVDVFLLHKELDHEVTKVKMQMLDNKVATLLPSLVKDEVGVNNFCFLLEYGEQKLYTSTYAYTVID